MSNGQQLRSREREQFCANCGESLGVFRAEYGDFLVCSARECIAAERDFHRAQAAEAEERARADNFELYR